MAKTSFTLISPPAINLRVTDEMLLWELRRIGFALSGANVSSRGARLVGMFTKCFLYTT
jgi:hypothetical protein